MTDQTCRVGIFWIHLFILVAGLSANPPASPASEPPPDLPERLDLPDGTRLVVSARRIEKRVDGDDQRSQEARQQRLLYSPDLLRAEYIRNGDEIHAVFTWEGGGRTEALQIGAEVLRQRSLRYPDMVDTINDTKAMDFELNGGLENSAARAGAFPGVSWYRPNAFVREESLEGRKVYVFAEPDTASPGADSLLNRPHVPTLDMSVPKNEPPRAPERGGSRLLLDKRDLMPVRLESRGMVYDFTYESARGWAFKIGPHLTQAVADFKAKRSKVKNP